jgi:surface antigen
VKYGEADPWGYYLMNCTSYTAWYLVTQEGKSAGTVQGLGNAYQWMSRAQGRGVASGTAKIGAVAWWGSEVGGGYGHVGIVTAVNTGNGTVSIAEYNQAGTGVYSTQTGVKADGYIDF